MKILVYGAGNIGSLYAAKLTDTGHDVSILARGRRLTVIREHGIVLEDFRSRERTTTRVNAVERLGPEDSYDLVLVILPRRSVNEVLPILAANRNTPSVMFFGNNAAGPDEMIEALGRKRVLLGFPGAAGVPHDEAIRYLILDRREQPTTIGEGVVREVATGCRSKEGAMSVLKDLTDRAEKVKSKILTPSEDRISDHQETPLGIHITAYIDHQTAKGVTTVRIDFTKARLERVAVERGIRRLGQLNASALERWLLERQAEGMSAGTRIAIVAVLILLQM